MEGNSSITRLPQRVAEDDIVNMKACQAVRGLTLRGRTVEGKISNSTEQGSDTGSSHSTYFCTFCDVYEDKDFPCWQFHEYYVHQKSRHLKCPECFALEYDNTQSTQHDHFNSQEQSNNWPGNSYNTNEHNQETCKHTATIGRKSYRQNFWGCGFCDDEKTTPMQSWQERCSHVASHMRKGERRNDWVFTNLIKGLLRQPEISELWSSYIHSLHGPDVKNQPEFHWIGTNGLCQKILKELEIGLRSTDEQIQLVKLAYIMGANKSTQPIDSFFQADWPLSPRDQSLEPSHSSHGTNTMSEIETEGDSANRVKTERSSQHEPSTRIDNRECRTKPLSSFRDVVSLKLLIKKFRQLLPRDSLKKRGAKTSTSPELRNFGQPRCPSPILSDVDESFYSCHGLMNSSRLNEKNEDLSEKSPVKSIKSMGSSNCGRSLPPDKTRHHSGLTPITTMRRKSFKQLNRLTLNPIHQAPPVSPSQDFQDLHTPAFSRSAASLPPYHSFPRLNHRSCQVTKNRIKFSGATAVSRVDSSPPAGLSYACFPVGSGSSGGSGVQRVQRVQGIQRSSVTSAASSAKLETSNVQVRYRTSEENCIPDSAFMFQRDSFDRVVSSRAVLADTSTAVSSSPEVFVCSGKESELSPDYCYRTPSCISQQQCDTIDPILLAVPNTNTVPDGSTNGASAHTEFFGVTDNRLDFSCKGTGYDLSQANAIVDQTSSYASQPIAEGKPSQNNPLLLPYSYAVGPSSLPATDDSCVPNFKIPMEKSNQPLAMNEPPQSNPLSSSKKRCSSAIGSPLPCVPDSASVVNLCSSQSAVGAKSGDKNSNKRQKTSFDISDDDDHGRMYACPYYLRHPRKYMNERSCPGPGWVSVHRLKAHLYNCHKRPIQCCRCSQCFGNEEELNTHLRIAETCQTRPPSIADGMSEDQKSRIRCKFRAKSEEEKWRRIWKILFPMDAETDIPKPYYPIPGTLGQQEGQPTKLQPDCDFEEFLNQGFRNKVIQKIEIASKKEDDLIEDKIKKHMVNIIHDCTTELFQEFRQWKNGNLLNKTSEVNACQKGSQIDSAPTLSTGFSSDGGILTGRKTPIQSPRQEQDEPGGEDCLQDLNLDPLTYTESWPTTLEIDSEWNFGARYWGADY